MEEITEYKKHRLFREIEGASWAMSRSLFPIINLAMIVDYDLYKELDIQQIYRDIHAQHERLENALKEMRLRFEGVRSDA